MPDKSHSEKMYEWAVSTYSRRKSHLKNAIISFCVLIVLFVFLKTSDTPNQYLTLSLFLPVLFLFWYIGLLAHSRSIKSSFEAKSRNDFTSFLFALLLWPNIIGFHAWRVIIFGGFSFVFIGYFRMVSGY